VEREMLAQAASVKRLLELPEGFFGYIAIDKHAAESSEGDGGGGGCGRWFDAISSGRVALMGGWGGRGGGPRVGTRVGDMGREYGVGGGRSGKDVGEGGVGMGAVRRRHHGLSDGGHCLLEHGASWVMGV
jgi:hypothetical protein